jgi:hypothetical protein
MIMKTLRRLFANAAPETNTGDDGGRPYVENLGREYQAGLGGLFGSQLTKHLAREFGRRSVIQNNTRNLGGE